jgi:hypothetical protein
MIPVPWKQWEGQVVDLCFPLRRYLGGTDRTAVYLTQIGDPEPRNAAIKLILADTDEADAAIQWDRAARLSNPHLLCLLRTGRWQVHQIALRYAVTEYAEENLADVLAERPLSAAEVRDLLKPLLSALAYIHGEGLVHGHVKPANILAVGDELKLSVDGITLVGEPGMTAGPPGPYDPPEFRARGCSPVGDVWSFGVTVVEALTQKRPALTGPKQEPVLPEDVPSEFLPILRACLRPDPRRRATIDEILELLAHPQPIAPETFVEPAAPASRRWLSYVLVGAAAVVLAGILAGPRLLRRPVANAQPEHAVVRPASAPVATRPQSPPMEASKPAKPAPSVPARDETPAPPVATVPPPNVAERVIETSPGEVVHQVMPDVSDAARKTIRGKVKIQVRAAVDAAGHVTDAKVESQNSRYFAKLALDAARQWQFASGPGDYILRFEFTTAGSTVRPSRVGR